MNPVESPDAVPAFHLFRLESERLASRSDFSGDGASPEPVLWMSALRAAPEFRLFPPEPGQGERPAWIRVGPEAHGFPAYRSLCDLELRHRASEERRTLQIAVGLFSCVRGDGTSVRRHVLTAEASVSVAEVGDELIVRRAGPFRWDDAGLPDGERPPAAVRTQLAARLDAFAPAGDELAAVTSLLRSWISGIPGAVGFEGSWAPPQAPPPAPLVMLAPALILRPRPPEPIAALLGGMAERLENSPPESWPRLVRALQSAAPARKILRRLAVPALADLNPEQAAAAAALGRRAIVAVAGPPGTGKSRLSGQVAQAFSSTGSRVLVLGCTERALAAVRRAAVVAPRAPGQSAKAAGVREPWEETAQAEIASGDGARWLRLQEAMRSKAGILRRLRSVAATAVVLPDGRDPAKVAADAERLLEHRRGSGKIWAVSFLRPPLIRETAYLRECRIDGRPCRGDAALELLREWLQADRLLAEVEAWWAGMAEPLAGGPAARARGLLQRLTRLDSLLAMRAHGAPGQARMVFARFADLANAIDAEPEQYDLAIVDQAGRSGMELLAVLHAARSVLVLGDERLPGPADGESFFHFVVRRFGGAVRLDRHYRCVPALIRFCSELSYPEGALRPVRPAAAIPGGPKRIVPVAPGGGAEAMIDALAASFADSLYSGKTFAVISLAGSAAAERVRERAAARFAARDLAQRALLCGEPDDFIGDERDVVFLWLGSAADPAPEPGLAAARLNVAVSCARDQVWLFHEDTPEAFASQDGRRRLLDYFAGPAASQLAPAPDSQPHPL